jgi:hypothetical protein
MEVIDVKEIHSSSRLLGSRLRVASLDLLALVVFQIICSKDERVLNRFCRIGVGSKFVSLLAISGEPSLIKSNRPI